MQPRIIPSGVPASLEEPPEPPNQHVEAIDDPSSISLTRLSAFRQTLLRISDYEGSCVPESILLV